MSLVKVFVVARRRVIAYGYVSWSYQVFGFGYLQVKVRVKELLRSFHGCVHFSKAVRFALVTRCCLYSVKLLGQRLYSHDEEWERERGLHLYSHTGDERERAVYIYPATPDERVIRCLAVGSVNFDLLSSLSNFSCHSCWRADLTPTLIGGQECDGDYDRL